MPRDETARLRDMLAAAREAVGFAENHTRADLDSNRQLALSLVKLIEIIGEAAVAFPYDRRGQYPQLP